MKTATEILSEHGINIMSLNDDFNTQLLNSMERYAEEKLTEKEKECEEAAKDFITLKSENWDLSKQIEELKAENELLKETIQTWAKELTKK